MDAWEELIDEPDSLLPSSPSPLLWFIDANDSGVAPMLQPFIIPLLSLRVFPAPEDSSALVPLMIASRWFNCSFEDLHQLYLCLIVRRCFPVSGTPFFLKSFFGLQFVSRCVAKERRRSEFLLQNAHFSLISMSEESH